MHRYTSIAKKNKFGTPTLLRSCVVARLVNRQGRLCFNFSSNEENLQL